MTQQVNQIELCGVFDLDVLRLERSGQNFVEVQLDGCDLHTDPVYGVRIRRQQTSLGIEKEDSQFMLFGFLSNRNEPQFSDGNSPIGTHAR